MTKSIAFGLALSFASSASNAVPISTFNPADTMVVQIRQACGAGMHLVNGVCIRTAARRSAGRCARGVTC